MHYLSRWNVSVFTLLLLTLGGFSSASLQQSPGQAFAKETPASAAQDEVIASVENHYRDLVDLTAKVVQKNFLKSLDKTQTFDAALFIKKPGKLRLEYTNGHIIVIDGTVAWVYSKKSEQAIKRTFKDFEQANIPVAFLLGAATIRDDFDATQPEADKPRVLDLLPKKPGAAMKKIRLVVDETGRISEMTIFDQSGSTTEIRFSDVKENTGLEDKAFRFKAPKGTEIIEQ